jgi:hypothetical protein
MSNESASSPSATSLSRRSLMGASLAAAALAPLGPLASATPHQEHVAANPVAQTAARPAAITGDAIFMQGTFDLIPPFAGWEGIERTTLHPGAEWPLGKSENDGEGPWLYRVESGELTINADGPISVTRAGEDQAIPVPPGTDVVLATGDQGLTPSGVTSRWRNDGSVPTVVMDAGITTCGSEVQPDGIIHDELVYKLFSEPPQTPVQVAVRRATLPAKAVLPIDALPGLELAYVESGQVDIIDPNAAAMTANPLDTTSKQRSRPIPSGPYPLPSFRSGQVFKVSEAGPAVMLLMTIATANP